MMTLDRWSGPDDFAKNESPYVDWFRRSERNRDQAFNFANDLFTRAARFNAPKWSSVRREALENSFSSGTVVPVPSQAQNDAKTEKFLPFKSEDIWDKLPIGIDRKTVIVGVIDTGIPLGLDRFRRADCPEKTRIVSAWQQTATHNRGQAFLPFGEELYANDIDRSISEHSHDGKLDEEAFNRATRIVEPLVEDGHRDLDFAAAHGAHVGDLATGFDPLSSRDADAYRMIAINLPPQRLHGTGGNFLAFWALYGVERILHVADTLWEVNAQANPEAYADVKAPGYPIVINFSYGMHAGPKDGRSPFEEALTAIMAERKDMGRAPLRIVLPVGNDNTEQGHARVWMGHEPDWKNHELVTEQALAWRVQPGDQTSNFMELWLSPAQRRAQDPAAPSDITANPPRIVLSPPGREPMDVPVLQKGEMSRLGNSAAVYRMRLPPGDDRIGYMLAIERTEAVEDHHMTAPAGEWSLKVTYEGAAANASFFIQSDQAGLVHSNTSRQSYLKRHPKDPCPSANGTRHRWDEAGRLRDSWNYETGEHTDDWTEYGPAQIKGTQSALATATGIFAIGGFRLSDGAPALYSATAEGDLRRARDTTTLTALFPSEVSPAQFGLLASGSRSGSTARLRGTSMATALATRYIAQALLGWDGQDPDNHVGSIAWLEAETAEWEDNFASESKGYKPVHPLKAGKGRVVVPPSGSR